MRVFTQYTDTKFINSLAYIQHPELQIASANIQKNLYKIHYTYNFDVYLFCANLLDQEISQFTNEFVASTKFIIYHPKHTSQVAIDALPESCVHISDDQNHHPSITTIPYLVNDHIFRASDSRLKNNDILCFLDNYRALPSNLEKTLYPNTKLPIKIFSKYIQHPQNLGILNEIEKAQLLHNSEYYLSCNTGYETEAVLCGAKVIDILDNKIIDNTQNKPYQTYQDFLLGLL